MTRGRVLFIDDEVELCRAAQEWLGVSGFSVTTSSNPETAIVEQALEREATRIATFSPYREGVPAEVQAVTDPYFHNTATRIVPALERPGPIVDIWKIQ